MPRPGSSMVPEVLPDVAQRARLQSPSPGAYGVGLAAAAGAAIGQIGDAVREREDEHWGTVITDYANQADARANEIRQRGMALEGKDALGFTKKELAAFDKSVSEQAGLIQHQRAQQVFRRLMQARRNSLENDLGAHERAQARAYATSEARGRQQLAVETAQLTGDLARVDEELARGRTGVALEFRAAAPEARQAADLQYTRRFHAEQLAARAARPQDVRSYVERFGDEIDPVIRKKALETADEDLREQDAVEMADRIFAGVGSREEANEAVRLIGDGKLRDLVDARVANMFARDDQARGERRRVARAAVYGRWKETGRLSYGAEGRDLDPEDREWFNDQVYQAGQRAKAAATADPILKARIDLAETAAWGGFLRFVRENPAALADPRFDVVREWGGRLSDKDLRAALKLQDDATRNPDGSVHSLVSDSVALLEAAEGVVVRAGKPEKEWSDEERAGFRRMRDEYDAWRVAQPKAPGIPERRAALNEIALRAKFRAGKDRTPFAQIDPAVRENIRNFIVSEERTQRGKVSDEDVVERYAKWRAGDDPALAALLGTPATRLAPIEVPGEEITVRAKGGPRAPMTPAERAELTAYYRQKYGTPPTSDADLEPALPFLRGGVL